MDDLEKRIATARKALADKLIELISYDGYSNVVPLVMRDNVVHHIDELIDARIQHAFMRRDAPTEGSHVQAETAGEDRSGSGPDVGRDLMARLEALVPHVGKAMVLSIMRVGSRFEIVYGPGQYVSGPTLAEAMEALIDRL